MVPERRVEEPPAASSHHGGVVLLCSSDPELHRVLRDLAARLLSPLQAGDGLAALRPAIDEARDHLLVLDWRAAHAGALEVCDWLARDDHRLPHLAIVPRGGVSRTVAAVRNGACEVLELEDDACLRHADQQDFVARLAACFELARPARESAVAERSQLLELRRRLALLRDVERRTLVAMVSGTLNKQVAHDLRIAERTVKKHRATVLRQMGAASLVDLVRIALRLRLV
jgi:FixJ family two-component response regulator